MYGNVGEYWVYMYVVVSLLYLESKETLSHYLTMDSYVSPVYYLNLGHLTRHLGRSMWLYAMHLNSCDSGSIRDVRYVAVGEFRLE